MGYLFLRHQLLSIGPASASKSSHRRGPPTAAGLPLLAIYIASWLQPRTDMNISIFDCFKFFMPSIILNPVLFLHRVIDLLTYLPLHLEGYDRTSTMFGHT